MHICFIIDNSPLLLQPYNYINSQSNTNSNISILDTIKISIQSSLNDLFRNGVLLKDHQNLHLFQTSTPFQPLSTFQHDLLHFNYQLKEIKVSQNYYTNPAETIKFALKSISRFRVLTQTQTIMGYREGVIYQPAIILFFSYGLTLRKIANLQQAKLFKYMRSQYKIIHFNICYGSQNEKDKNLQKFKIFLQSSQQNKKLIQWVQKMNKGQNKNIIKYIGKQNLSNNILNLFTSYSPSLYCQFIVDCEINNKFPQYFKNSQINYNNLYNTSHNNINNIFKIQLIIRNAQNIQNFIPLPLQINLKQKQNEINIGIANQLQIQQVNQLQFYIDLSKKLTRSISNSVPFDKYIIPSTNQKLIKLQKQLQRLGINQIFFPVYSLFPSSTLNMNNMKKQKDLHLIGLLHFHIDALNGNFFQLAISFPNYPFIQWITNALQSQSSYSDNRKIQKYLLDYRNDIPQFYHKFLIQYFKFLSNQLSYKYQAIANSTNTQNNNILRINKFKQKQQLWKLMMINKNQQKLQLEQLKKQNIHNHLNNNANCCLIYGDINRYIQYTKLLTLKHKKSIQIKQQQLNNKNDKKQQNQNSSQIAIKNNINILLDDIMKNNNKYNMKSYFNGIGGWKQGPMTRQLDKYGRGIQKIINQSSIAEKQQFRNDAINLKQKDNVRVQGQTDGEGLIPNKKIKYENQDAKPIQQTKNKIKNMRQAIYGNNIDSDFQQSIMPQKQYQSSLDSDAQHIEQSKQKQFQQSHIRQYQLHKLNKNIYINQNNDNINSIAVNNVMQHQSKLPSTQDILQIQKQLMHNKMQIQKRAGIYGNTNIEMKNKDKNTQNDKQDKNQGYFASKLTNLQNNSIPKIVKRSSSIDYLSSDQQQQPQQNTNKEKNAQKDHSYINNNGILLNYVNSIKLQNQIKMRLNNCNIKNELFMENIQKLKKIGLVKEKDYEKYTKNITK